MSIFRRSALEEFAAHHAERFYVEERPVSEFFGQNVFDDRKMKKYLTPTAYEAVMSSIREGVKIDRAIADEVADGMKAWAVEMGATHYTHWFSPLTDSTAEKS